MSDVVSLYKLLLVPFFLSLFLGSLFWFLAKWRGSNRAIWSLSGAVIAIAVLLPFRSYRISLFEPELKENLVSDAIVTTRKISIPGYPNAFNPSLIPYEEGYLLSFRTIDFSPKTIWKKVLHLRRSFTGLVKLDRNLAVCGKPYLLELQSYDDSISESSEDGRLFAMGEKVFLVFNDYREAPHLRSGRSRCCLYLSELEEKEGSLQPKKRSVRLHYAQMQQTEKNWMPFAAEGKLLLIYSGKPHLILEADIDTGLCQKSAETEVEPLWKWGGIKGGTPPHLIEGGFLTFFHSWQKARSSSFFGTKIARNYAVGAYLFEEQEPFQIKKMTPFPLGSLEDYERGNRRKVVFPGGIVTEGNAIHVVWGKNNDAIYLSTFDRETLFSSMIPCSND